MDISMSKESEKLFKELNKYLEDKDCQSEEEMNALIEQFIQQHNANLTFKETTPENAETADDYLELAESAKTKKKKLEFAQKALESDADCLDAEVMILELTSKETDVLIEDYQKLSEKAKQRMSEQGLFDDDSIGDFWGILETRPYMRLLYKLVTALKECGMYRKASEICQEMLRLCSNDNLGIRYTLMHLYAHLEDEAGANILREQFADDNSSQMLLPLSVLYYKTGDADKALDYLKQLRKLNKDTYKFFKAGVKDQLEDLMLNMNHYSYRPNTADELVVAFSNNPYLYVSTPGYIEWALRKLKPSGKKSADK